MWSKIGGLKILHLHTRVIASLYWESIYNCQAVHLLVVRFMCPSYTYEGTEVQGDEVLSSWPGSQQVGKSTPKQSAS